MADEWIRIGASRLTVGISRGHGVVVATLQGTADESALATILEAGLRLLEEDGAATVWDLRGVEGVAGAGGEAVARVMREAQRLEKEVRLVACSEAMERQLRAMGLRGEFWHYPSLTAATEGALSEPGHGVTVYLRRSQATRARLRLLVASLSRPCGLDEDDQARLVVALDDVCALATDGRGEETLTMIFFARDGLLTADVSWPVGARLLADVERIWERRPSTRPRIVAALANVETLAQADSVVIRLTTQARAPAPLAAAPLGSQPSSEARLPDMASKRTASVPRRPEAATSSRRSAWERWIRRPRLALVAGFAGRSAGGRQGPKGVGKEKQDE